MAQTMVRAASLLLVASFLPLGLFLFVTTPFHFSHDLYRNNITGGVGTAVGMPMVLLPLYSPNPNSSLHRHKLAHYDFLRRRRQLQSTTDARMRLYDDLLSNGYYTTRLLIGTPPQKFFLIVDTGSTVTYVPCSSCQKCGLHQDPRFKPELSGTYEPVKCDSHCNCDKEGKYCTYERRYAEMSSSSGVLGEDIISFGDESKLVPQRAVFGCENVETGDLYSQHADGIMGLGRGRLSVVDQLVGKGVISDSFSLCYGGMGVGGGAMVLGALPPPPDMVFSNSDPYRSPYYNIELKQIHVAGEPLPLNPKTFDTKHGTILDSGTTYVYLPKLAFVAFKNAIMKKVRLKLIPGPDPSYKDICFFGAGRHVSKLSKSFPEVDMVFSNGHKWSLSPENYLFQHTKVRGAYCLGIFQNGNVPTTLLGGIIVRNTLVTYDREKKRIGFLKTNCSELWKEQHVPVSPPTVPVNFSNEIPPALAPSGLPQNVLQDNFRVGLISFDMSLSISNSSMRPNFTELAKFIAHELGVNALQVHLLNFTSKGHNYLIRWAIFPAEPADYISNTIALSIILRLTEHRVRLPQRFGSYQLVEWNVEPQKKTWWEQHFVAIVVGISVTLVLVVSGFGILLVWRRRLQVSIIYKPVDTIVPEQELQPL